VRRKRWCGRLGYFVHPIPILKKLYFKRERRKEVDDKDVEEEGPLVLCCAV
jgi:hypothetical protein